MVISSLRQPTFRAPLQAPTLDRVHELGVIGLHCWVTLWIDTGAGLIVPVNFLLDSGSSYVRMNVERALSYGLTVPPPEAECDMPVLTAGGRVATRVRPGRIRGWWDSTCQGHPFDFPVLFRVNASPEAPTLLGLGGVVRLFRWTIDGTPTPAEPYGAFTADDLR